MIFTLETVYYTYCVFGNKGNWHEGHDSCKWPAAGSEDVQEDVLLHHAGRHAPATPHCTGGHDGEN